MNSPEESSSAAQESSTGSSTNYKGMKTQAQLDAEYKQEHPNAEMNPSRAEAMAYASGSPKEGTIGSEVDVVAYTKDIKELLNNDGELNDTELEQAEYLLGKAQRSREIADKNAEEAGKLYDRQIKVESAKTGILDKLQDVILGKKE